MEPVSIGLGIASILGSLFGGKKQNNTVSNEQKMLQDLFGKGQGAYDFGRENWLSQMAPVRDGAQLAGAGSQARIFEDGTAGGNLNYALTDMFNQSSNFNPMNIMQMFGGQYNTPTTEGAQWNLNNLGNNDSRIAGVGNTAAQGFAGGGWTPQRQQFLDQNNPLQGGNSEAQRWMLEQGKSMLANGGNTGFTQGLQDRAGEAVKYGGYTPELNGLVQNLAGIAGKGGATNYTQSGIGSAGNIIGQGGYDPAINSLLGSANSMFQSGGRTPQINAGSNTALQGLAGGGRTDVSNGMADVGLDLLGREALMSPQQAASFAMDTSGAASKNAFEAAQRHAQARGGGPGNVVAAGNSTGAMADFADKIAENQAGSLRDAMLNQQNLQLQQRGLGGQMASGAGGLENNRMGMFGDLLGSMENAATGKMNSAAGMAGSALGTAANRLGTGFSGLSSMGNLESDRLLQALGMVTGAQNSATNRAGTLGQLGLGADQNNIGRMGQGMGAMQGYTKSQQDALNSLSQLIGNQDQYALGLGNLSNSSSTSQANILNALFGNEQVAAQNGLARAGQYGQLTNNMFNNAQSGNNTMAGLLQGSWSPLTNLAGQGAQFGLQGLQNISPGNFRPNQQLQSQNAQNGGIFGSIMSGAGGLLKAFKPGGSGGGMDWGGSFGLPGGGGG